MTRGVRRRGSAIIAPNNLPPWLGSRPPPTKPLAPRALRTRQCAAEERTLTQRAAQRAQRPRNRPCAGDCARGKRSRPGLRTPEIVRNHLHDGRGAVRIAHVLHRSPGTATVLVQVPRSSGRRDDQSLTSLVGAMVGPTRDPTITYAPDDLTRTAARAGAHHPRSEVLRSRLARGGAQPNALFRRSGRAVRHAKGRVAGFRRWPRAICATAGEAAPPGAQQTLGGISGGRCRPCERDHGYGAGTEAVVGPTTDLASHGRRPVQHRRPSSMPARRIRILG